MHCPVCKNVNLVMSDRQGIEIDYCPQCRGVWLDRGELDKIIERSTGAFSTQRAEVHAPANHNSTAGYERHHDHSNHYRKKKREGFLSELFDFD